VRSLWFPSLREMRGWDVATSALYICWTGPLSFEVGAWLINQQAARFSPVFRGSLEAQADGRTRLVAHRTLPRMAIGLLAVWVLVLGAWLSVLVESVSAGERDPGILVIWGMAAAGTLLAGAIGWVMGGRALDAALPELQRVASDPVSGGDDWT
jgi:hypothetical protein